MAGEQTTAARMKTLAARMQTTAARTQTMASTEGAEAERLDPRVGGGPAAPRTITRQGLPFPHFPRVTFGTDVQILGVANLEIGEGSCIGDHSWLNVCVRDDRIRMRIGRAVLVGRHSMVSTGGYLEIGDFCLFGPRVSVVDADHGFADITRPYVEQPPTLGRSIVLEDNCWLGVGAVVAGNLTVGRGSVIGANSLVTKDVPPFSVVVGHPGRIAKMYDPVSNQWERIDSEADRVRVDRNRERYCMPDRAAYRELLWQNASLRAIDPIVAGRGECL